MNRFLILLLLLFPVSVFISCSGGGGDEGASAQSGYDYHTPEDDIEKINFSKVKNATKLAYLTGWIIANSDNTPAYRQLSMDEKIVLVKDSLERQKKFRNSDE